MTTTREWPESMFAILLIVGNGPVLQKSLSGSHQNIADLLIRENAIYVMQMVC